jgi:hypothetical protein
MLNGGDMKDDTGAALQHAWQQALVEPHGRHQIDVQCFLPFLVRERPEPPLGALDPPTQFTRISMPLQLLRSLSSTSCTPRAVAVSVLINSAGCWLREDVNAQWWRQKRRPLSTCGPWPLPSLWSRRSPAPACLGIRSGQRKKGRLLPLCNLQ